MKPLVSGAEAKRYVKPATDTSLLFPYAPGPDGARLIDAASMRDSYPKAWAYLRSYEAPLRGRENGKMDDVGWYRFGRHQNLDRQEIVKLIVPRLVANLACNVDDIGRTYLDNVDVGGVVTADSEDPFFLAGVLNSKVANFVFRRISKPFRGSYLSANKQFIAPLPIPPASAAERAEVASRARALQAAHTARREILAGIARRLSTLRTRAKPETWLFPDLVPKADLAAQAPSRLDADQKYRWAESRYDANLAARLGAITPRLRPAAVLSASFFKGELGFSIDGVPVVERVFADAAEGEFIVAQWKVLASTFSITDTTDGKKLASALRKLAVPDGSIAERQIIASEGELSQIDLFISEKESAMDRFIEKLYRISDSEHALRNPLISDHPFRERV